MNKKFAIFLIGAVVLTGIGLLSFASYANAADTIQICVKKSGQVYVIGSGYKLSDCKTNGAKPDDKLITIDPNGQQGPQGEVGPIGLTGAQGIPGPIGPQGIQGIQGPAGEQGLIGNKGPDGDKGPSGDVGPQGPAGPEGQAGPQGPMGPEGIQGPEGPAGAQGAVGPEGPGGTNGSSGAQGIQGPVGPTGAQGPQGPQGPIGATGPNGADSIVPGPKGDTGSQGPIGLTGATGEGIQGPQGIQGIPGAKGDTGAAGATGAKGDTGADSIVPGPKGDPGEKGDPGVTVESDPIFSAWNKSTGISITESQISNLKSYLTAEVDPQVGSLNADKWCISDGTQVNCTQNAPVLTETDPTVDLAKLQTLVSNNFHNLGGTDTDTTYTAGTGLSLVGTVFSFDTSYKVPNAANADTVTNGVYTTSSYADPAWLTSLAWSKVAGAPAFLTSYTETDPIFGASVAKGITGTQITNWDGAVTGLATEITARLNADGTLTTNLATEVTNRTNADTTEASTRAAADSTLTTNLAIEVADRTSADSALQTAINGKEPSITAGITSQYWRGDKSWATLDTLAVAENTNLYFTDARAKLAIDTAYPNLDTDKTNDFSGAYADLTGKPTKLSDFANDAGFITGYTETDPTVNLTKLQTLVSNDFHNLGGTDANTTYTAGTGLSLVGTTFDVTNGVYTTGSYVDPAWITSLAWSKITGAPAFLTSESDPQVGTLTNGKWCTSDGTKIDCAQNTPITSTIIGGGGLNIKKANATYVGLYTTHPANTTEGAVEQIMTVDGTLSNFNVRLVAANAVNSYTFTVRKNGAATTVTCVIGVGSSCVDLTHTVTFTAGDRITIEVKPSSPAPTDNLDISWTAKMSN